MKRETLKDMYGSIPASFTETIEQTLRAAPQKRVVGRPVRVALCCALALALLAACAVATFHSQVAEVFGSAYGRDMQTWLEGGDVALPQSTATVGGAAFTLEEVVYRENSLYGVGYIRPADADETVLIAEDHLPQDPAGYAVYEGDKAPEGTPSYAALAREKNARLLTVRCLADSVAVDGGEMLMLDTAGYSLTPQRDGSVRFLFELSSGYAIEAGSRYTIKLWASCCEMDPETGEWLEETRQGADWLVEVTPQPMAERESAEPERAAALPEGTWEIIVPEEFRRTGTLPVYSAQAREGFAADAAALLNTQDASLQTGRESIFYYETDGMMPPPEENTPLAAFSFEVMTLASFAVTDAENPAQLVSEQLTNLSLRDAEKMLKDALEALGLTGYECTAALDMSLARIRELGEKRTQERESGRYYSNQPPWDYEKATTADEGFFLECSAYLSGARMKQNLFYASAFVQADGIAFLSICDTYIPGGIYETPERLLTAEEMLPFFEKAVARERHAGEVVSIEKMELMYAPMRAKNREDGMVLAPVWRFEYTVLGADGGECYGEYSAVDGALLEDSFL